MRLNHHMENTLLWRNGLLLESKGVKIMIRASIERNTLEVAVRGAKDIDLASDIMNMIAQEIDTVS